ncbi:MAG: sulfurtransferase [Actinomycetota bacterium]|nr:sulfurtransferase [Actinomycetota bacterium]
MTRADILITASELARHLAAGRPVNVLDVRWELTHPDGREAFSAGHIPGAAYVSLEDELADHSVTGRGRHPLPSGDAVEVAARRWGMRAGAPTVVYDDWNRAGSSRAWWVLTAAGIADVRILDGGLAAWVAAGGELETGCVPVAPGDVAVAHRDLYHGGLPTMTADQAVPFAGSLLDARAPERFRGENEPVDPVAGHIPGARNAPSTSVLSADGTFGTDAELRRFFAERGVAGTGGVGAYCGSGVTAAVLIAALHAVGVEAQLFPGSWSQWCAEPDRPVATGD